MLREIDYVRSKVSAGRVLKMFGGLTGGRKAKVGPNNKIVVPEHTGGEKSYDVVGFISAFHKTSLDEAAREIMDELVGTAPTSGADILRMVMKERGYLAESLWPEGTSILAGDPKVGKSLASLQLAIQTTQGGSLFGNYRCPVPGSVLYYCLEDGLKRTQARLKGMGCTPEMCSKIHFVHDAKVLTQGFEEQLDANLHRLGDVRLVVIDPLVRIRPDTGSSNPYRDDYNSIIKVRTVLEEYGVSGVIVHHLRKGSANDESDPLHRVSGTQGLTGAVDHIFVMSKVRATNSATLYRTSRDDEELQIGLELDGITWNYAGDGRLFTLSDAQRQVYDGVRNFGRPVGPSELATQIGKGKSSVGEHMLALCELNLLKGSDGKYVLAA